MGCVGVTVLGSGSKGNAILVHNERSGLLIDAGFSLRETRRRMKQCGICESLVKGILVTHEHRDHVCGLRVCANHFEAPVYASRLCAEHLQAKDDKLRVNVIFTPGEEFELADFSVLPFSVQHDAVEPVGYVLSSASRKVGIAMDLGQFGQMAEYQLRSCDTLALESNHDLDLLAASKRPWRLKQRILGSHGHLSNVQSQELLEKTISDNTQNLLLVHISRECNTYELAEQGAREKLAELGRGDVSLHAAKQDEVLPTVWV
ncbi:MAG: MBL fold metallo-hydrolase [Lentisphaeria bacterium]|jgi:phosphoribosyl 1,2-cyclic phosphodiesterase|nr:MBL fold metallo-hydrolase [Lentisphaeria bacterium]MDY0175348.1 MBL fold metallo-hydrolase [Lentisphaeria bacterium]NLZ60747.1 MBL fold metallo-hydrolase [Lentisphaerota bacterium]